MLTGSPTVAVRIYNYDDATRLESSIADEDPDADDGVDSLRHFRDSYEHSIVFFVLPSGEQQRDQLGRRESFVNAAQQSLLSWGNKAEDENEDAGDDKKRRVTRTAIVSDISQVIETIDSLVQSLTPEKLEKRRKYFAQIANQNFLPGTGNEQQPTKEVIANHVAKTFNAWAERLDMAEGDSAVVLSMLGSLANVSTANASSLDEVPIRNASKELVSHFFGGANANNADTAPVEEDKMDAYTNDDDEFFDDVDDSELLQCPDPTSTHYHSQQQYTPFPPRNNFQNTMNNQPEFTPMIPTRLEEQPGYTPLSQTPGTGGYRQMNGYGDTTNYHGATGGFRQQHLSPPAGIQGGNYHHDGITGGMQGYENAYGGYTQQF